LLRKPYLEVLFNNVIEREMTELKRVLRKRTQLFHDLRNRRRYWDLYEEAEDRRK
jgi:hypothetical protein